MRFWKTGKNQTKSTHAGDDPTLHPRRIRCHTDVQVGELGESLAILGVQAFDETGIVQLRLTVRLAQIAKLVQTLHDCLAAWWRQLLPARKQRLSNFPLLLGRHLLPNPLAFAEFLLLPRSQPIPGLQTLANLRLLLRKQIPEALVVLQEFFLPVRRHILEAFECSRRQIVHVPRSRRLSGIALGPHGILAVLFLLLLLLASLLALRAASLCCCLANLDEPLPEGRRTE